MPKSQPHTGMTLLQTAQAAVGHYEHALEMLSRVRARGTIENAVQDAARMTDLVDVTNSVLSAVDQLPVAMRSKLKRMSLHATYAAMDSRSAWRGHLAQAHHLADQVDTALSEFAAFCERTNAREFCTWLERLRVESLSDLRGLLPVGWHPTQTVKGRSWDAPGRRREDRTEIIDRVRWEILEPDYTRPTKAEMERLNAEAHERELKRKGKIG